jgi:RNA polymerase sigma-70 factor (sigma-E family)
VKEDPTETVEHPGLLGRARDEAYTAYVSAKVPWLRRVAYLLCEDWHRADDLVQTAITKLYVNWRRAARVENLDGYVRTILVNTYLAEQRTSWWRRVVPIQHFDEQAQVAAAEAVDTDAALDTVAALATLPPRQRAAIVLRHYCDLSVEETAEMLGCSTGTIKSQTARGLATLRATLTAGGSR